MVNIAKSLLDARPGAKSFTGSTARTSFCRWGARAQPGRHLFWGSAASYDTWVPMSPLTCPRPCGAP